MEKMYRGWEAEVGTLGGNGVAQTSRTRPLALILQGVNEESKRHMWSCADKPPKIDGRFFKEPTVEG